MDIDLRSLLRKMSGVALLALVLVLAANSEALASYGPNAPRLEGTYADSVTGPRDAWRIYLKGSDPDGDLKFIHLWVNVAGMPTTPIRVRVDRDQESHISGYLKLFNTKSMDFSDLFGPPIRLSVSLEDRAGNRSNVVDLPVSFYLGAKQDLAPAGAFQDRLLGRIPAMTFPHGIGL